MTGFRAEIEIDSQRAQALFQRLADAGESLRPLMADIAEGLLHRTEDRFDRQEAPDGTKWPELSPKYAKRKAKKHPGKPLLVRGGRLRGELRPEWGDFFAEVSTAALDYAALHQFGGTSDMAPGPAAVPARPFLGAGDEDVAWIEETAADYLDRVAGGG